MSLASHMNFLYSNLSFLLGSISFIPSLDLQVGFVFIVAFTSLPKEKLPGVLFLFHRMASTFDFEQVLTMFFCMTSLPIPSLIFSSAWESEALRTTYGYVCWLECFSLLSDLAGSRSQFLRQQPVPSPVFDPTFCITLKAQLTYSR